MTTNDTLPVAIRGKYELVKPLNGGPVFAFPRHGGLRVDFSGITERQAEALINRGWPGLRRKAQAPPPVAPAPSPAPAVVAAPAAAPDPVPVEPAEDPLPGRISRKG